MSFARPLALVHIVSGWGDARDYRGEGAKHEGIDLSAELNTPVFAVDDGVVQTTNSNITDSAGRWVRVKHAGGWVSEYLHLNSFSVSAGDVVRQGDQIGLTGQTSTYSIPPHLHFQTRVPDVEIYQSLFGTPVGGFGHATAAGGTLVPSEPLVPADAYDDNVVTRAAARGIPLYAGDVPVLPGGDESFLWWILGGAAAWWFWKRRG